MGSGTVGRGAGERGVGPCGVAGIASSLLSTQICICVGRGSPERRSALRLVRAAESSVATAQHRSHRRHRDERTDLARRSGPVTRNVSPGAHQGLRAGANHGAGARCAALVGTLQRRNSLAKRRRASQTVTLRLEQPFPHIGREPPTGDTYKSVSFLLRAGKSADRPKSRALIPSARITPLAGYSLQAPIR